MRRRRKIPFIIVFLILAVSFSAVGFIVGYFSNAPELGEEDPPERARIQIASEDIGKQMDEPEALREVEPPEEAIQRTVTNYQGIVTQDTSIIFRTLYTQCQNTLETKSSPENDIIGLSESDIKEYYGENNPEWKVIYFSDQEVVLLQRKEQVCPQHYVVTEHQGYIAVYRYSESGEKILVEKTEIPISVLPGLDQEKLKRGMLLNSKEEVDRLLEDFSS